ncbi:hypothetical protein HKX48_009448, partial [Thoreauomyces humboldtii]
LPSVPPEASDPASLQSQLFELQKRLTGSEGRYNSLLEEHLALRATIADQRHQPPNDRHTQTEGSHVQAAALESTRNGQLYHEVSRLTRENTALAQQFQQFRIRTASSQPIVAIPTTAPRPVERAAEQLRTDLKAAHDKVETLVRSRDGVARELYNGTLKNQTLTKSLQSLTAEHREVQEQLKAKKAAAQSLQEKLSRALDNEDALRTELEERHAQSEDAETEHRARESALRRELDLPQDALRKDQSERALERDKWERAGVAAKKAISELDQAYQLLMLKEKRAFAELELKHQRALEEHAETADASRKEVDAVRRELKIATDELVRRDTEKGVDDSNATEASRKLDFVKRELKIALDELARLDTEGNQGGSTRQQNLQEMIDEFQKQQVILGANIADLAAKGQNAAKVHKQARQAIAAHNVAATRVQALEKDVQTRTDQARELRSSLAVRSRELHFSVTRRQELEKTVQTHDDDVRRLKDALTDCALELSKSGDRREELQKTLATTKKELRMSTKRTRELQKTVQTLETQSMQVSGFLEKACQGLQVSANRISRLEKTMEGLEQQQYDLRVESKFKAEIRSEDYDELTRRNQEILDAQVRNRDLEHTIEALEVEARNSEGMLANMR